MENDARLTKLEGIVAKLGVDIDELTDDIRTFNADYKFHKEKSDCVEKQVGEHERVLRGSNGNVGLIAMMERIVPMIDDLTELMRGKGDCPGLVSDIRDVKKTVTEWKDTQKWVMRLIGGIFVTAIIEGIILLVR